MANEVARKPRRLSDDDDAHMISSPPWGERPATTGSAGRRFGDVVDARR
jgi:hypothetical protein